MKLITRILCPIDFSASSMHAFAYAEELAVATDSSLVLVHAFDRPESLDLGDQTEPANAKLKEQFAAVKATIPVERRMHAGPPGEVICWLADDRLCDLIVMGTRGLSGIKHVIFGSVAEYVLKHAHCPVLTTRKRPPNEGDHAEPLIIPIPPPRFM